MIEKQREGVSKYLYDLSKILFAAAVVGNLIEWSRFGLAVLLLGTGTALIFFWLAYSLDGLED